MKQRVTATVASVAIASLLVLSGCGTATDAAGPAQTIVPLSTPNYKTVPAVTVPPTTAAPATVPAAGNVTTSETTYTVKANDSGPLIARMYNISGEDLAKFNGWASINQVIHPGDVVKIPAGATVPGSGSTSGGSTGSGTAGSTPSGGSTAESSPASGEGCTYTVKANDTPIRIAKKTGITVDALNEANASSGVMNSLLVGAKVVIPPPGKC